MVCLSIAGSIIAGAHYYAVDLPQQNAVTTPENYTPAEIKVECRNICNDNHERCGTMCSKDATNEMEWHTCRMQCDTVFYLCNIDCDLK